MRLLKVVSLLGIVFSLIAHLVSWTSPDLVDFIIIGIPLHLVVMVIATRLYKNHAIPLQHNSDLRWFHHASSGIHALLFVSVMSLMFHMVVVAVGLSEFSMFVIRALSSIWVYFYSVGYAYASWSNLYRSRFYSNRTQEMHRTRIRRKGNNNKIDLHIIR